MPLVLVTGPPGTGKSTIADAAATQLGAAVFAWDWAMAALTGFDDIQQTFSSMDRDRYRSIGWSILGNLATAQLRRRASAVLDGVARPREVEAVRRLAEASGVQSLIIATRCSDRALHQSRVERRRRDIPGWHELDWDHIKSVLAAWTEPEDVDLILDATVQLADNLDALADALRQLEERPTPLGARHPS